MRIVKEAEERREDILDGVIQRITDQLMAGSGMKSWSRYTARKMR